MKVEFKISDYPFKTKLVTRWRDLDAFQHVNNAVFATYIENARVDLFIRWGLPSDGAGQSLIVASLKIDYKNKVCVKPWGHEFLIYESNNIGIWFLKINLI